MVNPNAASLLWGVSNDHYIGFASPEINNVVVLANNRLSVSLKELLAMKDEKVKGYDSGKERFLNILKTTNEADLLASTPLKRAVLWSLSSMSSLHGVIDFSHRQHFYIHCNNLINCSIKLMNELFIMMYSSILYKYTQLIIIGN